VFNPEVADTLVGVGEAQIAALRMRERCRVEVEQCIVGFTPVNPALEVCDVALVAVNVFSTEIAIDLVQIQTVCTRYERLRVEDVRA